MHGYPIKRYFAIIPTGSSRFDFDQTTPKMHQELAMTEFIRVLAVDTLAVGENKAVAVFGRSVLVCRSTDGFHAVENACSHQHKPLEGGRIRGKGLLCPVHGTRFDLETGMPSGTLTQRAIPVYPLRIVDGWIELAQAARP